MIDDPTETDDQATDASGQDTPPTDPAARAAYFEERYQEQARSAKDLARDNKRLADRVKEEETGKKYWHEEATRQQTTAKPTNGNGAEAAIKKTAKELPDLADLATSDDGTARLIDVVADALVERFGGKPVTSADVDKTIKQWVDGIQAGGRIQERYPDLADDGSDFANAVNTEIEAMRKDPTYEGVSKTIALELACAKVDANFAKAGKHKESSEEARTRKVSRQSAAGGSGSGKPARKSGGEDTELTENQKKIARNYGLTEDEYRQSALKGVRTYKERIGA